MQLLQIRTYKRASTRFYMLELTDGNQNWAVSCRYSEMRECHSQLKGLLRRGELPIFPPKEPLLRRVFSNAKAKLDWKAERQAQLARYVAAAVAHPVSASSAPVQRLVARPVAGTTLNFVSVADGSGSLELFSLSSVRARLTGELGEIDVVLRTDDVRCGCPLRVQLALRPLDERDFDTEEALLEDSPTMTYEVELGATEEGVSEATRRLSLEPGSFWEITARGIGHAGALGVAVCLQLQVPTGAVLAGVPAFCPDAVPGAVEYRESPSPAGGADSQADSDSSMGAEGGHFAELDSGASTEAELSEEPAVKVAVPRGSDSFSKPPPPEWAIRYR